MRFTNLLSDKAALQELGRRLIQVRLNRAWTQAQLASSAGVSKRTVERLEAGESTHLSNLARCLRALERLDGLERLLPEEPASPIDLLERQGRRRRVRARAFRPEPRAKAPWTWGDET